MGHISSKCLLFPELVSAGFLPKCLLILSLKSPIAMKHLCSCGTCHRTTAALGLQCTATGIATWRKKRGRGRDFIPKLATKLATSNPPRVSNVTGQADCLNKSWLAWLLAKNTVKTSARKRSNCLSEDHLPIGANIICTRCADAVVIHIIRC